MSSPLAICTFLPSPALAQVVQNHLSRDSHTPSIHHTPDDLRDFILLEKQQIDCLVLEDRPEIRSLYGWLYENAIVLPCVIFITKNSTKKESHPDEPIDFPFPLTSLPTYLYHAAEIRIGLDKGDQILHYIDQAIGQFLKLSPTYQASDLNSHEPTNSAVAPVFLSTQHRLAEKLKERLGYLGVYYKRDSRYFLRHLSLQEKQELLDKLRFTYREIILGYFSQDDQLNQKIDEFVNLAFFSDIPVTQIVEIHMDLMDEFSKQLKLEGRSEDILLDYRLTLIDTIAHLCEMYRRSIPRES
ncbi:circadian clock protein KaiA [Geitlerinema sp. PCC 7407]|uniref:circadian clock protein KaiA n=1 Tax=Geitlerinema sp. PCC 7407 TaxID=1173025 RepID=UPI00029FF124|nr:circadian clock protein KaiA [Geitlerinema sp. PCC 7407]AFY67706.1 KaiA family protein [Geitlerinema sp. PCC 7407]